MTHSGVETLPYCHCIMAVCYSRNHTSNTWFCFYDIYFLLYLILLFLPFRYCHGLQFTILLFDVRICCFCLSVSLARHLNRVKCLISKIRKKKTTRTIRIIHTMYAKRGYYFYYQHVWCVSFNHQIIVVHTNKQINKYQAMLCVFKFSVFNLHRTIRNQHSNHLLFCIDIKVHGWCAYQIPITSVVVATCTKTFNISL